MAKEGRENPEWMYKNLRDRVDFVSQFCETDQQAMRVAFMLILKSLDILEARIGEEFYPHLEAILHDRHLRKKMPVTEEQAGKLAVVRKWTGA